MGVDKYVQLCDTVDNATAKLLSNFLEIESDGNKKWEVSQLINKHNAELKKSLGESFAL